MCNLETNKTYAKNISKNLRIFSIGRLQFNAKIDFKLLHKTIFYFTYLSRQNLHVRDLEESQKDHEILPNDKNLHEDKYFTNIYFSYCTYEKISEIVQQMENKITKNNPRLGNSQIL